MEKNPFWKLCRHEQLLPVSGCCQCQCVGDEAGTEEYLHVEMNGKISVFSVPTLFPVAFGNATLPSFSCILL